MKTPKEAAKELISKFDKLDLEGDSCMIFSHDSKNCAMICVDFMIKEVEMWIGSYMGGKRIEYLEQVKKELEAL